MTINVWWDEAWDSYYAAQRANTGFTAKRVVKALRKADFRVRKDPECKIWEIRGHGLYGILSLPATIYYDTNLHISVKEDWNKFSDATLQLNIFDFPAEDLTAKIYREFRHEKCIIEAVKKYSKCERDK